jgi:hypothetical protein
LGAVGSWGGVQLVGRNLTGDALYMAFRLRDLIGPSFPRLVFGIGLSQASIRFSNVRGLRMDGA